MNARLVYISTTDRLSERRVTVASCFETYGAALDKRKPQETIVRLCEVQYRTREVRPGDRLRTAASDHGRTVLPPHVNDDAEGNPAPGLVSAARRRGLRALGAERIVADRIGAAFDALNACGLSQHANKVREAATVEAMGQALNDARCDVKRLPETSRTGALDALDRLWCVG